MQLQVDQQLFWKLECVPTQRQKQSIVPLIFLVSGYMNIIEIGYEMSKIPHSTACYSTWNLFLKRKLAVPDGLLVSLV